MYSDPVDSELRSVIYRYTILSVVLAAAAVWTISYANGHASGQKNGAPVVLPLAPEAENQGLGTKEKQ